MGSSIRTLFRLLGKYRIWYISSALLLILSIFVRSFEPKILQIAIDKVIELGKPAEANASEGIDPIAQALTNLIPNSILENFGWLLIALAVIYVIISFFHGAFLFSSSVINSWCGENLSKSLRDRMFAHIQRLPLSFFTKITRGELIQRSTGDVDTVKGFISGQVINLVRLLSIFGFSISMVALMSWKYALLCICLAPFLVLSSYFFFKKEKKVWRIHEEESDKFNNLVQENLNGIRTVIAYANEEHESMRFREQNEKTREIGIRHNRLHMFFWPVSDFLGFSQISISIIAGGYFAMVGEITIGQLLASYTYIGMIAWPLRQLGRTLSEMGMAQVALERLGEIINAAEEDDKGAEAEAIQGDIVFDGVTFGYKNDDIWALSDVSFKVNAGEKIAVIGPTGSGKSSLIKLLLRLYEPNEGKIELDDKVLNTYKRSFLRKKIGMAHQKPFLFSTSIRENIAYSLPKSPLERVLKAANTAQFAEISGVFPEGYETLVGEKGVTLSGGQKQRVALARTILPQPEILILDDITSAVDTETEQAMFRALKDELANKTTFILSHRITSIQQADRVFVFNKGKLVQQGTPAELEKIPGYYQEIHKIQADVEKTILRETTDTK
ncbi:MAG: ABC transporter ATP-binding protein/permease [Bacteroidia bacterium]|nr:ABC transporter ATP-binding protein/permease [Bacteroidia bacterium]